MPDYTIDKIARWKQKNIGSRRTKEELEKLMKEVKKPSADKLKQEGG